MNIILNKVIANYRFPSEVVDIKPIVNGIINNTYVVICKNGERFLLQKINTKVFTEPFVLIKNIENITNHIEAFNKKNNDDKRQNLKVIRTTDDSPLCVIKDDITDSQYFRVYNYIENSITYNQSTDSKVVYNTGCAFGNFQKALSDYPVENLEETIPFFHHTQKRYEDFLRDLKLDPVGRVNSVGKEINFLVSRRECYGIITTLLKNGIIPTRVTHNDTKVNNVMMDEITGDFITVIDLDTVMPGSSLYDYGDAVRSVCSTTLEDEEDLSKVKMNKDLFVSFTDGFLSETANCLTEVELAHMPISIKIITCELAMRFLNDYINGDTYFKTKFDTHNLVRARNQMKLVTDIEENMPFIESEVKRLTLKHKKM